MDCMECPECLTSAREEYEMATELGSGPVTANDDERAALDTILRRFLAEHQTPGPKLVGAHGEEIALPDSVFQVLRQLVYHLAHGRGGVRRAAE
jgi:hypothetical protein